MNWDEFFMSMAETAARKSKDRSTKVGAIVVGPDNEIRATGYNGFPRGVRDYVEERHERPLKYAFVAHAEANAIYAAARVGTPLKGCRLYATAWPCAECAKAIIQAGICEVIAPEPDPAFKERWKESMDVSNAMFGEAGVVVRVFDGG